MTYTLLLSTYLALPVGDLCVSAEPGEYVLHTDEPLPGVPPVLDDLSPWDPLGELLTAYVDGKAWTEDGPRFEVHEITRSTPAACGKGAPDAD